METYVVLFSIFFSRWVLVLQEINLCTLILLWHHTCIWKFTHEQWFARNEYGCPTSAWRLEPIHKSYAIAVRQPAWQRSDVLHLTYFDWPSRYFAWLVLFYVQNRTWWIHQLFASSNFKWRSTVVGQVNHLWRSTSKLPLNRSLKGCTCVYIKTVSEVPIRLVIVADLVGVKEEYLVVHKESRGAGRPRIAQNV